jgi:hypothetical protein
VDQRHGDRAHRFQAQEQTDSIRILAEREIEGAESGELVEIDEQLHVALPQASQDVLGCADQDGCSLPCERRGAHGFHGREQADRPALRAEPREQHLAQALRRADRRIHDAFRGHRDAERAHAGGEPLGVQRRVDQRDPAVRDAADPGVGHDVRVSAQPLHARHGRRGVAGHRGEERTDREGQRGIGEEHLGTRLDEQLDGRGEQRQVRVAHGRDHVCGDGLAVRRGRRTCRLRGTTGGSRRAESQHDGGEQLRAGPQGESCRRVRSRRHGPPSRMFRGKVQRNGSCVQCVPPSRTRRQTSTRYGSAAAASRRASRQSKLP